ncbi:MAG: exodeoxyribonuclease VII small subunit [Pseudomonadota bacterium]
MAKAGSKKKIDLEKSLAELESLVAELESGELPLDSAMQKFERGVSLTRDCQQALTTAEQKVSILMQEAGLDDEPEAFDLED